jgi:acetyl esterase/lipase
MFDIFSTVLLTVASQVGTTEVNKGLVEMTAIKYATVTNLKGKTTPLLMDVAFPAAEEELLPAVIFVHGGAWREGKREDGKKAIKMFANGRYFAATIDYRLAPDSGFPDAVHDCKAAIRFLRRNANSLKIDPDRIGIIGYSAGGHLAALVGLSDDSDELNGLLNGSDIPTNVTCVGSISGVVMPEFAKGQLRQIYDDWALDDKTVSKKDTLPSSYIDSSDPPVYLLCGESDEICPSEDSKIFVELLDKSNVEQHIEVIENSGHIIQKPSAYLGIVGFFDAHLGGNAKVKLQQAIYELGDLLSTGD